MSDAPCVRMINTHAEGEIGYVAIKGVPDIPGQTLADRLAWLNSLEGTGPRRHLMLTPRGNPACSVNLVMPPVDPAADAAFIILQPDAAHASSNSICVTTALLETGHIPMSEPETVVTLETAAGLVRVTATCKDGKCECVSLDMVPAFVKALDVSLDTAVWGRITADICYGGVFYALVDAGDVGLAITPQPCRRAGTNRHGITRSFQSGHACGASGNQRHCLCSARPILRGGPAPPQ